MKVFLFLCCFLGGFSAWSQSFALAELEQEIEFSTSGNFPMNVRMPVDGYSRPAGMRPNEIALTFDDGPSSHTRRILEVLSWPRFRHIKATFFVHVGAPLSSWQQDIIEEIDQQGHKVANHGVSHSILKGPQPITTVVEQLMSTHHALEPYIRNDIWLYRNPGLYWSSARAHGLNAHPTLRHYVGPISVNVGGGYEKGNGNRADWECNRDRTPLQTCAYGYINKIISNFQSGTGSIVLLHDIHAYTADMLPLLLDNLQAIDDASDTISWDFLHVQDIPAVRAYHTDI
jgi:peptidoglycan/xylan/chitin deacetylase (PgdA/CDA1 family)